MTTTVTIKAGRGSEWWLSEGHLLVCGMEGGQNLPHKLLFVTWLVVVAELMYFAVLLFCLPVLSTRLMVTVCCLFMDHCRRFNIFRSYCFVQGQQNIYVIDLPAPQ